MPNLINVPNFLDTFFSGDLELRWSVFFLVKNTVLQLQRFTTALTLEAEVIR